MDTKTIIYIAIGAFLVLMNIISFSMMALDKKRAQKDKTHSHPETRIPEKRLFDARLDRVDDELKSCTALYRNLVRSLEGGTF